MNKEKKVKIALVGVGGFGEKIANAILRTSKLKLVALCHPESKIADEYGEKYGCRSLSSLEDLLQNQEVEAIALVTPNHLHYEQIKTCLKNNKHIFVEKPMTNKLCEAKDIIERCRDKNLILMVGHNMRRNKAIRKLKELVEGGKIGNLVSAEINMSHAGGMKLTPAQWRYYRDKCPGGPLIMLGTHAIEVSNYLFGPAKKVAAVLKKQHAPTETEDTSLILVELESGSVVYICNNYNTPGTHFIRVYGTRGILDYNRNLRTLSFQGEDVDPVRSKTAKPSAASAMRTSNGVDKKPSTLEYLKYEENDTLLEEMEEFANCILQGKKPETGALEAFNALAVIEAALISQKENKFIDVEKI